MQFQHGIGIRQAGRLICRHNQQQVGTAAHLPHEGVKPRPKIDDHRLVAPLGKLEKLTNPLLRYRVKAAKVARSGSPGQTVKPRLMTVQRLIKADGGSEQRTEVMLRHQPELDIDIGQTKIAVQQQNPATALGKGMGERDGKPGLANSALAGGDSDHPANRRLRRHVAIDGGTHIFGSRS